MGRGCWLSEKIMGHGRQRPSHSLIKLILICFIIARWIGEGEGWGFRVQWDPNTHRLGSRTLQNERQRLLHVCINFRHRCH